MCAYLSVFASLYLCLCVPVRLSLLSALLLHTHTHARTHALLSLWLSTFCPFSHSARMTARALRVGTPGAASTPARTSSRAPGSTSRHSPPAPRPVVAEHSLAIGSACAPMERRATPCASRTSPIQRLALATQTSAPSTALVGSGRRGPTAALRVAAVCSHERARARLHSTAGSRVSSSASTPPAPPPVPRTRARRTARAGSGAGGRPARQRAVMARPQRHAHAQRLQTAGGRARNWDSQTRALKHASQQSVLLPATRALAAFRPTLAECRPPQQTAAVVGRQHRRLLASATMGSACWRLCQMTQSV